MDSNVIGFCIFAYMAVAVLAAIHLSQSGFGYAASWIGGMLWPWMMIGFPGPFG